MPYTAEGGRLSDNILSLESAYKTADGIGASWSFAIAWMVKGVVEEVPNATYGVDERMQR
jgi:hypothetical protein